MRVALAEDLFLLRDGLKHLLLAHGIQVSAAVGNAPSLLAHLDSAPCDLAIIDIRLPPDFSTEGLEAAREIRRRHPGFPVLMLSQYVEPLYAQELLADGDGAIGYLLKERVVDADQFVATLTLIAAGGTAMDPDVITRMLAHRGPDTQLGALTARELEVLAVMAEGRSNAAIGQRLFLSEGSISKYTASIFAKLGLPPSDDDNRRVRAVLTFLNAAT